MISDSSAAMKRIIPLFFRLYYINFFYIFKISGHFEFPSESYMDFLSAISAIFASFRRVSPCTRLYDR